jgi:copper transport protein
VIIGLCGLFLMPAGAAQAHAALISTNPVAGSIVPAAPSQVIITFDEHVTPVQQDISVIGPNRKKIDSGTAVSVGNQLRIPVRTGIPTGTYLVSYRVISADGHPVAFGFYYSVGAPSPGGAPKPLSNDSTNNVVATTVSVMQFIGFGGLCLVVGPTLVLIALWPRRLDRTAPIRLAYTGLGAVAVAAAAGLYLQAPYGSGGGLFSASGSDLSNVMDSTVGRAYMVRLAVVVICAFLLRPVMAGRGTKTDHVLLVVLGTIGVGTWAFAGHPAASSVPPLTVIADVVHLASVAIWLGGLVMLVAFLLRKANTRELTAILPVWSNWATLAVTVLVLGGTAQALIEIGSFGALFHTTYGQLVIVKVLILGVILLFAGGARRVVQRHAVAPALVGAPVPVPVGGGGFEDGDFEDGDFEDGDFDEGDDGEVPPDEPEEPVEPVELGEPQIKRLRRSVFVELALAVVVLVATSVLVQSSPVRNAAGVNANSQGTISLTSSLYTLQVEFLPSGSGTDLHMFFYNPAGAPQPIKSLDIVATSSGGLTQDLGVAPISDSHWTSTAVLVPGKWTFSFTARTTAIDEATVTTVQNIG